MQQIIEATHFAAQKHTRQRRKDTHRSPYINHPVAVANVLSSEAGIDDAVAIVAALLHDTLEDTDTEDSEIADRFGEDVLIVVKEVTDDKRLPKKERKRLQIEHAATISLRARYVKLADKICNLRDMASCPPDDWTMKRRVEYFDWCKAVIDAIPWANDTLERLFREAYARRPEVQ